jgi:hypothetical protein
MDTFRAAFIKELEVIGRSPSSAPDSVTATPAPEPVVAYCGCTSDATSPTGCPDDGAEPFVVDVPLDLVGLALSGGGIRSATFNLGLLQGLAERDLLGMFDYLSTVSGGGYVGSFWSAWRKRFDENELFPTDTSTRHDCVSADEAAPRVGTVAKVARQLRSMFSPARHAKDQVEPAIKDQEDPSTRDEPRPADEKPKAQEVKYARSEPDPIRHLREFSRFLAPRWGLFEIETWLFFGSALSAIVPALIVGVSLLALLIWYVLIIDANSIGGHQAISIWGAPFPLSYVHLALIVVGVTTALVMWWFERETRTVERQPGETYYGRVYFATGLLSVVFALVAVNRLLRDVGPWGYFEILPLASPTARDGARFFAPAIGWSAAMLVLILLRGIATRFVTNPKEGFYRAAVDRIIARLLAMAVFWTVMILFIFASYFLWMRNAELTGLWTTAVGAGSGGIFGYLQRLLSHQPGGAKGGLMSYAQRYALPLLAMTALVAAAIGVACLVFTCISIDHPVVGLVLPLAIVLAALVFYNPNEIGMHPLYRSRLSRAYLGASNKNAKSAAKNRQSIERPDDDMLLEDLPETRPVHLVCCAANDLSGNHLANLRRGARSATLSRFGFTLANRFQDWDEAPTKVTLATAMTASAAAFNSNMGSLSMDLGPSATFLMAALNLRLGYWYHITKLRHFLPGIDLIYEMLSWTNSGPESQSIHLSDGGHFENLALYELLRRRCKYIIASDCGADSEAAFDDVGNALRRAREDFGVEVDNLDLAMLKPNEKGYSRQHLAVGDITYPGGDRGILLVFKPTLVGDEPGDVLQYKTRNSSFPHESTGDQFYDEKQWESYRRLGLHAARVAFRFLDERDRPAEGNSASDVFGDARWEWLPVPPALNQQLLGRGSELDAIERQVMGLGGVNLLRDLYPELRWDTGVQGSNKMKPEDLARVVPLFTQVIQLMESVYTSCEMESYWTHPLNVGWVNWFGRWATTPAFRALWPFLAPMFNPRMTRFVEDKLELKSKDSLSWKNGKVVESGGAERNVAEEIWKAMHPGSTARDRDRRVSYRVTAGQDWEVDVALLFFKEKDGVRMWSETWNDPDFFVPPSLWGAGIGQAFLEKLGPAVVTIDDDPARRKQVSDTLQMYSQAGFRVSGRDDKRIEMKREAPKPATTA